MSRRSTLIRALAVVGGLVALPFTVSGSTGRLRINDAVCEQAGGTCCYESGSTCYPNGCSNGLCSQDNAYWKSAGSCRGPNP